MLDAAAVATAGESIDNSQTSDNSTQENNQPDNQTDTNVEDLFTIDDQQNSPELVFITAELAGYDVLLDGIDPEAEIHILNPLQDAIFEMTEIIGQYDDISAIHILSHGNEGVLEIGNIILSSENLPAYTEQFQLWQNSLSESADILLYGCNVALNDVGVEFVNTLSSLTEADIGASDDLTGVDGNVVLEYQTGNLEAEFVVSEEALQATDINLIAPTMAGFPSPLSFRDNGIEYAIEFSIGDTLEKREYFNFEAGTEYFQQATDLRWFISPGLAIIVGGTFDSTSIMQSVVDNVPAGSTVITNFDLTDTAALFTALNSLMPLYENILIYDPGTVDHEVVQDQVLRNLQSPFPYTMRHIHLKYLDPSATGPNNTEDINTLVTPLIDTLSNSGELKRLNIGEHIAPTANFNDGGYFALDVPANGTVTISAESLFFNNALNFYTVPDATAITGFGDLTFVGSVNFGTTDLAPVTLDLSLYDDIVVEFGGPSNTFFDFRYFYDDGSNTNGAPIVFDGFEFPVDRLIVDFNGEHSQSFFLSSFDFNNIITPIDPQGPSDLTGRYYIKVSSEPDLQIAENGSSSFGGTFIDPTTRIVTVNGHQAYEILPTDGVYFIGYFDHYMEVATVDIAGNYSDYANVYVEALYEAPRSDRFADISAPAITTTTGGNDIITLTQTQIANYVDLHDIEREIIELYVEDTGGATITIFDSFNSDETTNRTTSTGLSTNTEYRMEMGDTIQFSIPNPATNYSGTFRAYDSNAAAYSLSFDLNFIYSAVGGGGPPGGGGPGPTVGPPTEPSGTPQDTLSLSGLGQFRSFFFEDRNNNSFQVTLVPISNRSEYISPFPYFNFSDYLWPIIDEHTIHGNNQLDTNSFLSLSNGMENIANDRDFESLEELIERLNLQFNDSFFQQNLEGESEDSTGQDALNLEPSEGLSYQIEAFRDEKSHSNLMVWFT